MSSPEHNFVIAVYNDIRSEIRERVALRDSWISKYLFANVIFIGASFGIENLSNFVSVVLCIVMPLTSVFVAVNVSAHVKGIESAADYLRLDFNEFIKDTDYWVPFWEWKTGHDRNIGSPEEQIRNNRRLAAHIISLHGPSIISLIMATIIFVQGHSLVNYSAGQIRWSPPTINLEFIISATAIVAGITAFVVAVYISRSSFKGRNQTKVMVAVPAWYKPLGSATDRISTPQADDVRAPEVKDSA